MPNVYTVVGPPGTGKTTYLADQIAKASDKLGAGSVLVASLTKAASREIAGRSLHIDDDHVGTLHAICYRALGRGPILDAEPKLLKEFGEMYGRPLSHGVDGKDLMDNEPTGNDATLVMYNLLRQRMMPRDLWPSHVTAFADDWEAFRVFKGATDFVHMIELALERLPGPPHGAKAIFYDEAQDGSALELALIRQWATQAESTIVAGDPRQAIFEWRGASPEAFAAFSARKILLKQSYRVPKSVHIVAQRIASTLAVDVEQDYHPRDADGEVVRVPWLAADPGEWLGQMLALGGSTMILATCRYMLAPVIRALRESGVPFHNPFSEESGDWNPLARHHGISPADRLIAFVRLATWRDLAIATDYLRAELLPRGSKAVIAGHKADPGSIPFDVASDLIGEAMLEAAIRKDLTWYEEALLPSKARNLAFALSCARRMGLPDLAKWLDDVQGQPRKGLTVGTIHSVKGGEADTVLAFPDLSPAAFDQYDSANPDPITRAAYVAVTRARERLLLGAQSGPMAIRWPHA